MRKLRKTLAIGSALALAFVTGPAQARDGRNAAVAAGVIGGLALGAAAASAPRAQTYYPGPQSFSVYEDDPGECRVVIRRVCDEYGCQRRRSEVCD